MNIIVDYLKNIEPKYYLGFGIGYVAGWLITWKIIFFFIAIGAILLYSSYIHKNNILKKI